MSLIFGAPRQSYGAGGMLRIIEPVTLLNTPISRRVCLYDQQTRKLIREQWADADTGLVTFSYLHRGPWVLLAFDHLLEYEAVAISDRVATADGARP